MFPSHDQQEAHWERRPTKGKYSKVNKWTQNKRASRLRVAGATTMATGIGIKYLGYASYAGMAYGLATDKQWAIQMQSSSNFYGLSLDPGQNQFSLPGIPNYSSSMPFANTVKNSFLQGIIRS